MTTRYKKVLSIVFILILLITVSSFSDSTSSVNEPSNEQESPEEEITIDDYELISDRPRSTIRQYKYKGPGTISIAEKIFIEQLQNDNWNYDKKEEEPFQNIIHFRNGAYREILIMYVSQTARGEVTVIIEEPYL